MVRPSPPQEWRAVGRVANGSLGRDFSTRLLRGAECLDMLALDCGTEAGGSTAVVNRTPSESLIP
jgi:hypothetical protein